MGIVQMGPPVELVRRLQATFGIKAFVETGTFRGGTALWASHRFERVVTIERSEALYREVTRRFGHIGNIEFLFGDSRERLGEVIGGLAGPALLWLDAHWCGGPTSGDTEECPVLGEIAIVNRAKADSFVLVDDARLFMSPPPPPHRVEQWPDILTVLEALRGCERGRYLGINEDVIIAVPERARSLVAEYCREVNARAWEEHCRPAFQKGLELMYRDVVNFRRRVGRRLLRWVRVGGSGGRAMPAGGGAER
jgi:hypothetical protein